MKQYLLKLQVVLSDLVYGRKAPERKVKRRTLPKILDRKQPVLENKREKKLSVSIYENVVNFLIQKSNGDKVVVLPFEDPTILTLFSDRYKNHVFKYILRRLNRAIHGNYDYVDIFEFGNTKTIAQINSKNYETQLNVILKYFLKIEDYETASACRDLIRQTKGETMNREQ